MRGDVSAWLSFLQIASAAFFAGNSTHVAGERCRHKFRLAIKQETKSLLRAIRSLY